LIDEQAQDLNDLASRLLGAAKLDSVDFKPQWEPVLFSDLVNAAIQSPDAQRCRGRCHVHGPAPETAVLADRQLITTALAQLVDNALKYSVPGSPIDIGIAMGDAEVTVTVRNQGLVIAPADRERIFERFYRAAGTEQHQPGQGWGLQLLRESLRRTTGACGPRATWMLARSSLLPCQRRPRGYNDDVARQDSHHR
jgi:K+-sensing histidine kinase KdpD